MSTSLQQETVSGDGIISSDTAAFSLSRSPRRAVAFGTFHDNSSADIYDTIAEQGPSGEQQPLLPRSVATKKPFRRARPLWYVPYIDMMLISTDFLSGLCHLRLLRRWR